MDMTDGPFQDLVSRLDTITRSALHKAKEEALAEVVTMLREHKTDSPAATFDDAIRLVDRRREGTATESEPDA